MENLDGNLNNTDMITEKIIENIRKILLLYNRVHTEATFGPEISILFNSLKEQLSNQLISKGTKNVEIKWSTPKPSWPFVPWIAFQDGEVPGKMSTGIYCCILFRKDMKGFYVTLIQGVTQYKTIPKNERTNQLQLKNDSVRKKLNYLSTHGFLLDNNIELLAPTGSVGENYNQATVLYKYYPFDRLPNQKDLIKDIQTIIDAYRTFSSNESKTHEGEEIQGEVDLRIETNVQNSNIQENFIEFLMNRGYYFDSNLVVSFLLSLKVKPFVILTGSSGCGKTKLAQLFAQYQSNKQGTKNREYIVTDVKVGKSASHEGWTFPRTEFFNSYPELKKFQGQYEIEVDGIKGTGNLELLTRLFFESNEEIKKRLEELAKIDPTRRITLKIFLPMSNSGNYEIVPVGANWTENRHIVGFYNLITKEYQKTRSLDLILQSQESGNERFPFFLILDEMNLSHVERYFADFLSAIESDESIPLHSNEEFTEVPTNIRLNSNISIIGTVNVDETTYMFSPKVLDRANTIEVQSESVSNYLMGNIEFDEIIGNMQYLENILEDASEIRSLTINLIRNQFRDVVTIDGNFWELYSNELAKFQIVLKEAGLEFGFRVVNEISRFILAAWRFEGKPREWNNWQHYFDMQIKQKMLPKVHGSERSLGRLIDLLFQLCYSEKISKTPREYSIEELDQKAVYYSAAAKLKEMDQMLYAQRYTSFTR